MFVLALIHTFPFIVFHIWKGDLVEQWSSGGVWVTGVVAIIAQAWLTFMSIPWIRYAPFPDLNLYPRPA
jgi:ferric-chelate reductase